MNTAYVHAMMLVRRKLDAMSYIRWRYYDEITLISIESWLTCRRLIMNCYIADIITEDELDIIEMLMGDDPNTYYSRTVTERILFLGLMHCLVEHAYRGKITID